MNSAFPQLRPTVHIDSVPALRRRRSAALLRFAPRRQTRLAQAAALVLAAAGLVVALVAPSGGAQRNAPTGAIAPDACADTSVTSGVHHRRV